MGNGMTEETLRIEVELGCQKCRCGLSKDKGVTFCRHCYFSLPATYQRALHRKLGEGYTEAYAAAVRYLGDLTTLGVGEEDIIG